jgi:hypothetical protein
MKYWLKECPRCGGDLREESDVYGKYVGCMQCGYSLKVAEENELRQHGRIRVAIAAPSERAA